MQPPIVRFFSNFFRQYNLYLIVFVVLKILKKYQFIFPSNIALLYSK